MSNYQESRCRDQMYVTDLDKLNPLVRKTIKVRTDPKEIKQYGKYDVTEVVRVLSQKFPDDLIVAVVHDHDIKRDGQGKPLHDENGKTIPRAPHIHIGKHSKNAKSLNGFAKALRDPRLPNVRNFNKMYKNARGVWENLVSYLFHRSKSAVKLGKYPYPFSWGAGNFDFKSLVLATAEKVKKREAAKLRKKNGDRKALEEDEDSDLLEKVRTGELQLADIAYHDDLQLAYARNKKKFDTISEVWMQSVIQFSDLWEQALLDGDKDAVKKYEKKLSNLHAEPSTADVYYFCGPAGSGKTFLAKRFGAMYDSVSCPRGVYVAGGNVHQFDKFRQQYCVVLDDIRADTYPPETLLNMLDPNLVSKYLDARYQGSAVVNLKYIALTNTSSLDRFVRFIKDSTDKGDAESQYFRRFFRVVMVDNPISLGEGSRDVVVPYAIYRMEHEDGLGNLVRTGQYSMRMNKFRRNGDETLSIFRKSEHGTDGYDFDHYSDWYLHKEKTAKILVPISELDKNEKPMEERHRVNKMLSAETKKAEEVLRNAEKKNTTTSADKVVVNGPF